MAITAVRKLNQLSSTLDFNPGQTTGIIKRQRSEYYQVVSNSLTETADAVETASAGGVSVPILGAFYGNIPNVIATKISSKRDRGQPYHWTVQVDYTTMPPFQPQTPPQQDPNNPADPRWLFPEIQSGWVKREFPMYMDFEGNPIISSSGEPVDPPPLYEVNLLQIRIARYERSFPLANMLKFSNTLNTQPFWGWPKGCVHMLPITAGSEFSATKEGKILTYWKVQYTIELTSGAALPGFFDDFGVRPIDRGTCRYMEYVDGNLQPATSSSSPPNLIQQLIVDAHGIPKTKASFLDGHGQPLPPGHAPVWSAFAAGDPPPLGNRLDRNGGNIVDGYVPCRTADLTTLKDPDGNALPDLRGLAANAKVGF